MVLGLQVQIFRGALKFAALCWPVLVLLVALVLAALAPKPAAAVPGLLRDPDRPAPCAACHVGAFGPQLKPYGRDFKLHGYVADRRTEIMCPAAGDDDAEPPSPTPRGAAAWRRRAAPAFGSNDNFALDQLSLYYARG